MDWSEVFLIDQKLQLHDLEIHSGVHCYPVFLTLIQGHVMYNVHLHNRPSESLAPLPLEGNKKKIGIKCAFLLTQTVHWHFRRPRPSVMSCMLIKYNVHLHN